jgi:hypothetical protein
MMDWFIGVALLVVVTYCITVYFLTEDDDG